MRNVVGKFETLLSILGEDTVLNEIEQVLTTDELENLVYEIARNYDLEDQIEDFYEDLRSKRKRTIKENRSFNQKDLTKLVLRNREDEIELPLTDEIFIEYPRVLNVFKRYLRSADMEKLMVSDSGLDDFMVELGIDLGFTSDEFDEGKVEYLAILDRIKNTEDYAKILNRLIKYNKNLKNLIYDSVYGKQASIQDVLGATAAKTFADALIELFELHHYQTKDELKDELL